MAAKGPRKKKGVASPKANQATKVAEALPASALADQASSPLILSLGKNLNLLPGCGFGIDQSVIVGSFAVKLPAGFDVAEVEPLLAEFSIAQPNAAVALKGLTPELNLVARVHAWQAVIQRGANVPVFGGCRVWDNGNGSVGFAMPTATLEASRAALRFVSEAIVALTADKGEETLAAVRKRFEALRPIFARHALLGLNAMHFIEGAHALRIPRAPWVGQIWAYGHGRNRLLMNSSVSSHTPQIGVSIARDKLRCNIALRAAGLPVAAGAVVPNVETAVKLAQQLGYPVVVKPADLDQGMGVTAGIEDEADLRRAFEEAAKLSKQIMVEKHHYGRDYRVTVLRGKVIKIMDRRPGGVTGDGKHTVAELVDQLNERDRAMRAQHGRQRTPMTIDEEALKLLSARGYDAGSVLPEGEFVPLRRRANISAGGTYEILPPETLHPDNRMLAINAAMTLGLDIAGIDVISGDPAKSWRETGGIIVEVNAQPQIGYRDTEALFGQILMELMGGKGEIPVHLLIMQNGLKPGASLPQLAAAAKCNAASFGTDAWVQGAGRLGPFASSYHAGRGLLLDRRTTGAMIVMDEKDVLRFGLPAAQFGSIRLLGNSDWQPSTSLQQLLSGHSKNVVRQNAVATASAVA